MKQNKFIEAELDPNAECKAEYFSIKPVFAKKIRKQEKFQSIFTYDCATKELAVILFTPVGEFIHIRMSFASSDDDVSIIKKINKAIEDRGFNPMESIDEVLLGLKEAREMIKSEKRFWE